MRPRLTVTIDTNVNSTILNLEDDVRSWKPGDTLVVASTDYSMYQAEEFQVVPCRACASNQVKVAGKTLTSPSPGRADLLGFKLSESRDNMYQLATAVITLRNKTDPNLCGKRVSLTPASAARRGFSFPGPSVAPGGQRGSGRLSPD